MRQSDSFSYKGHSSVFLTFRAFLFSIFLLISVQSSASAPFCSNVHSALKSSSQLGYRSLYQNVQIHTKPSAALRDPLIEEARKLHVHEDFKVLSDMAPRALSAEQKLQIRNQAQLIEKTQSRRDAVRFLVESLYEHRKNELLPVTSFLVQPMWTIKASAHQKTFEHIESMWFSLVRRTPKQTESSLIPLPYPLLIPGARFQEGYYWDSYFAFPTLLKTGRSDLVRGQVENFLFLLKNYGLVPNGTRDYYLTRSQPPLLSQMVRLLVEHEMKNGGLTAETRQWLTSEVYPLIKKDYEQFWMNPQTRLDERTGLNHFSDSSNTPRPERHSSDKEEQIAKTYVDVRAEAESGKDFTDAFEGEASQYASVMLNSILFQVEKDLNWMARLANRPQEASRFDQLAEKRRNAMNKYMWDASTGAYRDYHLRTGQQSPMLTADIFLTLHMGIASQSQAQQMVRAMPRMERAGGLMSSEKDSGKQWDAPYGWAPHHYFAINGLQRYGYQTEARRLAQKWVTTVDRIYQETGKIIEKIDAVRGGVPVETGDKYPTQDGFLWTNGVYAWALTDVLGFELAKKPN